MDVSSATATASAATATPAAEQNNSGTEISADFETFLKMLTVQMQNQDPLDPMKSEDFAVQLATFSGVEQQVQTNSLLESLASQVSLMGMSQLASWVGMEGRAPVAASFQGQPITLAPEPAPAADGMVMVVKNANGVEIQREALPVSSEQLDWTGDLGSGTAPHGLYTFTLESYKGGELLASEPVDIYAKIAEARIEDGQTILLTDGGEEIPADQVSGLRNP